MAENENTQVAVVETSEFPFLQVMHTNPDVDLVEVMQENLGDEDFTIFDLDRVVVPSGGATTWEVPGLSGVEETKTLRGIIVAVQKSRGYWKEELEGEGTPPDCSSNDGETGFGEPGGSCLTCPLNQFGSGKNGSKGCKEIKNVFLLTENSMLPVILQVPPTSLKALRKYSVQLTGADLRQLSGVVTEFTLQKTKSRSGFTHSAISLRMVADLTGEQKQSVKRFKEAIEHSLKKERPADAHGDEAPAGRYEDAPQFD